MSQSDEGVGLGTSESDERTLIEYPKHVICIVVRYCAYMYAEIREESIRLEDGDGQGRPLTTERRPKWDAAMPAYGVLCLQNGASLSPRLPHSMCMRVAQLESRDCRSVTVVCRPKSEYGNARPSRAQASGRARCRLLA